MVMIALSASPACGPRFLAGCAPCPSSSASQCGPNAWQQSSNGQKSSTSRSNMDASPHLMAPTQEEEFKGDKRLASPQTRNSGWIESGDADSLSPIPGLSPHEQLPPDRPRHWFPDAALGGRVAAGEASGAVRGGGDCGPGSAGDARQLPRFR